MLHFPRFTLAAIPLQLLVLAGTAAAQPTAEQQSALRNNCRSDFMSNCSGVTPGGAEALQCLQRNVAKLSPGCQNAVNALGPRSAPVQATAAPVPVPAPAAPPQAAAAAPAAAPTAAAPASGPVAAATPTAAPTAEQQGALRQLCGADYMAKCGHVPPATREALQCLQSHSAELSANCRGALALFSPNSTTPAAATSEAPARSTLAAPAAAPRPAQPARAATVQPAAVPAAAAPRQPTQQQRDAIRASCQSDFMARCSGVQPGGADALRCLQRNSAQLSSSCKNAVAAISGGAPAAQAATAVAAPATAAPASMPSQQQQSAIKAACQRDFMFNCRGVTPGGPEAFACLQRNSSRLSPACQSALAAVAGGAQATVATQAAMPEPAPAMRPGPVGPLRRALRERMMGQ